MNTQRRSWNTGHVKHMSTGMLAPRHTKASYITFQSQPPVLPRSQRHAVTKVSARRRHGASQVVVGFHAVRYARGARRVSTTVAATSSMICLSPMTYLRRARYVIFNINITIQAGSPAVYAACRPCTRVAMSRDSMQEEGA